VAACRLAAASPTPTAFGDQSAVSCFTFIRPLKLRRQSRRAGASWLLGSFPITAITVFGEDVKFWDNGRVKLEPIARAQSGHTGARRRGMNVTLLKALVALAPACVLSCGSTVLFLRGKTAWSFLQLLGAGGLVIVALTHVCEALQLFPWMHWGLEASPRHSLDLLGAVLGLTLFPIGYLLHALAKEHV
jgi:hypothetical protein